MKSNSFQTDLETIARNADTSMKLSGNLSDVAFKKADQGDNFTTIKDRITVLTNEYQSPTQAVSTPEISQRLAPADEYAKGIMTLSGQYQPISELPPTATQPITADVPGADSDLVTVEEEKISEPKSFAMGAIVIVIVIGLLFLILNRK